MTRPGFRLFAPLLAALLLLQIPASFAADILLRLPSGASGNHVYFHRLLTESLRAAGHSVTLEDGGSMPQPRAFAQLESGFITADWMLQTPERDTQFVRIDHPLTQGLIGQRVLFVPKGSENMFANVKDLAQLRATGKVAGLGKGWFDTKVWAANDLPYAEQGGEWRQLFPMLAAGGRGIDYFPRGANEIIAEAALYPDLSIEPNLLLVYQRDFYFYLGRGNAGLKPLIEAALRQAEKSGLQKALFDEHVGRPLAKLNLDKRVRIKLVTP
ncbi:MAG: hypothetical protein QM776_01730 [Rhodocyclaceae bacterium]